VDQITAGMTKFKDCLADNNELKNYMVIDE